MSIQKKILDLDKVLDQGGFSEDTVKYRSPFLKDLQDVNSIEALDIAQNLRYWSLIDHDVVVAISYVFGSVHSVEVDKTARIVGCSTFSIPFNYLGIKVGGVMSTSVLGMRSSPWLDILREASTLKSKGIDLCALIRKKVGNGEDTLFWEEHWIGEKELRIQFPRLYALETCKHISVAAKMRHNSLSSSLRCPPSGGAKEDQFCLINSCLADLILPQMKNYWYWSLEGSSEFSVKSARILINDSLYPTGDVLTRWVKLVSIKINIFSWRVFG
ncbi:hypothetical protein Tco_0152075 [Tanacetum coccineum]